MLIVKRNLGQSVTALVHGVEIRFTVVEVRHGAVRVGITAPEDIPVHRDEVWATLRTGEKRPREA